MSNSSIWPIDKTLSAATTPSQSGAWSNGNEGVLSIPQTTAWLEPHHQITKFHIQDSPWWGALALNRNAVYVFYSSIQLGWY